ncbi:MAG: hypothetical protein AAGM36_04855 [Cyanobacteria bacterium J06597_1]
MKLTRRLLTAVLAVSAIAFAISASPAEAHRYRDRDSRVRVETIDYGYGRYDSPCYYGTRVYRRPYRRIRRLPRRDRFLYVDRGVRFDRHDRYDRRVRTNRGGVGVIVRF